jgi:cation transport ATPase
MIKGMTTQEAARTVRERLLQLDGVLAVRMSITDPSARVDYQPSKLSPSQIATMLGRMGYSTTVRSMLRTM